MSKRPIVLLVDDDPSMRELLTNMFQLHGGFRIGGIAQDGFEAAMLAADLHPDVVVLDFYMPRWDGEKAARFIHKHCPGTKIVGFSAVLDSPPDWADRFLLKTEVEDLLSVVEQMSEAA